MRRSPSATVQARQQASSHISQASSPDSLPALSRLSPGFHFCILAIPLSPPQSPPPPHTTKVRSDSNDPQKKAKKFREFAVVVIPFPSSAFRNVSVTASASASAPASASPLHGQIIRASHGLGPRAPCHMKAKSLKVKVARPAGDQIEEAA